MIEFIKRVTNGFGILGIIIIVGVIGVFTGGGLYFKEFQHQKTLWDIGIDAEKKAQELKAKIGKQQKQLNKELGTTSPNTQGGIDTSTWKTYRNEKYGFEVKYPPKYSFQETVNPYSYDPKLSHEYLLSVIFAQPPFDGLLGEGFFIDIKNKALNQEIKDNIFIYPDSTQKIFVNGNNRWTILNYERKENPQIPDIVPGKYQNAFIKSNGYLLNVRYISPVSNETQFLPLIATFKFIE